MQARHKKVVEIFDEMPDPASELKKLLRYDKTVQETPVAIVRIESVHKLSKIACRHPSYLELRVDLTLLRYTFV